MAKKSGLGDRFWVHGFDLSGDVGSINRISTPVAQLPMTGISSSAEERLFGRVDGLIDFQSWFNDAALQSHPALSGLLTTDLIVTYCRGAAAGDPAFWIVSKQVNYDPARGDDGSLDINVQAVKTGTAVPEWGVSLVAGKVTHPSAASSGSVDNTASSASGFAAVLHAFSIASGTATPLVEHSTDDSIWATLATFANVTARTAERVTGTGTVNRYARFTTTGTFTTLVVWVGLRRGESVDRVAY